MMSIPGSVVVSLLKHRLKNGWILLMGNMVAIERIEEEVYPPGEEKNHLFGACLIPGHPPVFIGKKTNELQERLGSPPDFNRTLAIIFANEMVEMSDGTAGCAMEQIFYPPDGDLDRAVEQLFTSTRREQEEK